MSDHYQPTARQRLFHSCPADIILYGGAAGGGKSEALLWEGFLQMIETPGNRGLLLRRTFPELNRSLITRSLQKFPREVCRYHATDKAWIFNNGSVLEFGYCEKENDIYNYQSAEYGFIGFDELTHFTYAQWDYLVNSRLRAVMPGAWPRVRAASNPGNVGHAWVKAIFVDKGLRDVVWENSRGIKFAFIPAKVEDNPYILKYDPGYIERMNMLDPKWRAALRDGDWDTFAGQFFDTWDPLHHVLDEHFDPPKHWHRFRALDWGFSKPYSVGWYAVTPTGALYRYRELYGYGGSPNQGSRETAEEVARRIAEIEAEAGERDLIGPADNQIWNSGKDAGKSVAEWFQDYGITWIPASKNRPNGWNEFRSRLQLDYDENGRPQPRFFVSPRCEHFIRTVPTLVHSESKPEDLDTDGEDHCADEARYAFMYWREHGDNQAVTPIRNDLEDHYNVLVTPSGEPIYLPRGESTSGEWWE